MQIISISLSKEEVERVNKMAKEQNCSRSQVIKDAFNFYELDIKWRALRKIGDQIAKRLNIESDDDVEAIFG